MRGCLRGPRDRMLSHRPLSTGTLTHLDSCYLVMPQTGPGAHCTTRCPCCKDTGSGHGLSISTLTHPETRARTRARTVGCSGHAPCGSLLQWARPSTAASPSPPPLPLPALPPTRRGRGCRGAAAAAGAGDPAAAREAGRAERDARRRRRRRRRRVAQRQVRSAPAQHGLPSNRTARITSDCGSTHALDIKWPESPRIAGARAGGAGASPRGFASLSALLEPTVSGQVCPRHSTDYPRTRWLQSPRIAMRRVPMRIERPESPRNVCPSGGDRTAPPPVVGVSIAMERERQQNDSLADGQAAAPEASPATARSAVSATVSTGAGNLQRYKSAAGTTYIYRYIH